IRRRVCFGCPHSNDLTGAIDTACDLRNPHGAINAQHAHRLNQYPTAEERRAMEFRLVAWAVVGVEEDLARFGDRNCVKGPKGRTGRETAWSLADDRNLVALVENGSPSEAANYVADVIDSDRLAAGVP